MPLTKKPNVPDSKLFGIDMRPYDEAQSAFNSAIVDTLTFGLANKAGAAVQATWDALHGKDWGAGYNAARAEQAAEDQYDQQHHPFMRRLGQGSGLLMTIGAADLPAAASLGAKRIAPLISFGDHSLSAVTRALRPVAAAAATGSGLSVAGQLASDTVTGRPSSPQTYLADAAGGGANALATLAHSPVAGAAADSFVNEGVRSLLTGQPFEFGDAAKGAVLGGLLGGVGFGSGKDWSDGLNNRQKGQLGELMADVHLNLLGDGVDQTANKAFPVSGGKTIADHVTLAGDPAEAKFGTSARLTPRQTEANAQLPGYQIFHYVPPDVGKLTGGLLGTFVTQPIEDQSWDPTAVDGGS